MKAAAETTLTIAADPRHLGARIGITAVLHTWGSALTHRESLAPTAQNEAFHLRLVVVEVDAGGTGASNPRAGRSSADERGEWDNWALVSYRGEPVAPGPAFSPLLTAPPYPNMLGPYILGVQGSGVDLSLPRHG
jgi:hypothetical protein